MYVVKLNLAKYVSKPLKSINFHFLQRNQTKLPKDFSEVCLQSKRFVYLPEGGSV